MPLALLPRRALTRSAVDARLEMQVAQTTLAAPGNQCPCAFPIQIRHRLAAVQLADDRPHRHAQHHVFAALAVTICTAPVLAMLGTEDAGIAIVDQGIEIAVGNGPDTASPATIATIRPTTRHIFLAPERGRTITPVAGDHLDFSFVKKFHGICPLSESSFMFKIAA